MADYIDEALIKHALAQTTITDIVNQRVYHIKAPVKAEKPYVVLNLPAPSNDSEEFGKARMGQPLFQWTCVSSGDIEKTPADAFLVAHAIMDAFHGLQGAIQGITVKVIWCRGPRELLVASGDDFEIVVESEVHYEEK